jgi:hypothetical protein
MNSEAGIESGGEGSLGTQEGDLKSVLLVSENGDVVWKRNVKLFSEGQNVARQKMSRTRGHAIQVYC